MDASTEDGLLKIFYPHVYDRVTSARKEKKRFVHYTSAEAAMNILKTKSLWMRSSTCMNDYLEVQHGLNCVLKAYNGDRHGKRFQAALNQVFADISPEVAQIFDNWTPTFKFATYLTCVSEHRESEDTLGRLSMWRAYSGDAGIALVLNGAAIVGDSTEFGAISSPVSYVNDVEFEEILGQIAQSVSQNKSSLKTIGRELFRDWVFNMLRALTIATKHKGFAEEQEWRVIYSSAQGSPYLEKEARVVNKIPQTIYKIPLKDIPEIRLIGLEIPSLIERIIIGPTQFPMEIRKTFTELLREAGVPEPEKRVFVSDIPLRT